MKGSLPWIVGGLAAYGLLRAMRPAESPLPTDAQSAAIPFEGIARVHFPFASDVVSDRDAQGLAAVAALILSSGQPVRIVGHTDSVGGDEGNLDLGQRRAYAVADVLHQYGVPVEQMAWDSAGSAQPIADNATAEGRALNRRVEIWWADE